MGTRSRSDTDERTDERISDVETEVREVRSRVEDLRVGQERIAAQLQSHATGSEQRHADLARRFDELAARGDGVWIPGRVVVGIVVAILSAVGIGVVGGATIAPAATGQVGP
jgi:hypothetical protein